MSSRTRQCHTRQATWGELLLKITIIPMNQRKYSWDISQIDKFMDDIYHIFKDTNYYEKMGSIIYYTGNKERNEIWDGQQRFITTTLLVYALSIYGDIIGDDKFANKLKLKLSVDTDTIVENNVIIENYKKNIKNTKIFQMFIVLIQMMMQQLIIFTMDINH